MILDAIDTLTDRLADYLLAALLGSPTVVYGSTAVLVLLLAAGIGWPAALLILLGGNAAVAVWWGVHLLITRRPW